jgi:hypothetical protein
MCNTIVSCSFIATSCEERDGGRERQREGDREMRREDKEYKEPVSIQTPTVAVSP